VCFLEIARPTSVKALRMASSSGLTVNGGIFCYYKMSKRQPNIVRASSSTYYHLLDITIRYRNNFIESLDYLLV
jgi:hypothetical protein